MKKKWGRNLTASKARLGIRREWAGADRKEGGTEKKGT